MFLIGILIVAAFFIVRICQFRSLNPRGNTITAVLSTTQVLRGKHGPDGEEEPTAVLTEVFIDSGSGDGFKRPRKPDMQVKYDTQRKASIQKSDDGHIKPGSLPVLVKGANGRLQSDSSTGSLHRLPASKSQQPDRTGTTADYQTVVLPANGSSSAISDGSMSGRNQAKAADSESANQDRTVQKGYTDKSLPAQNAQQALLKQTQAEEASSKKIQAPSPPPPVITSDISRIPADFDWQTYLLYNPELRDAGISTQQQAEEHYVSIGYAQGMIYKRLRVLLRYTACTGLINQHYSHIAAFSLCAVLGAELVLPPAVKRDSFAHYFSVFKEHNEVKWTPAPLESLLNVDKIVEFWRSRGLTVHRVSFILHSVRLRAAHVLFLVMA